MKYLKFAFLLLLMVITCAYLFIYNNQKQQFLGTLLPADYSFNFSANYQEINISTSDKNFINAVLLTVPHSKGLVLFLHGGGGNISIAQQAGQPAIKAGYDFLAFDYPGYGKTTLAADNKSFYLASQLAYNYAKRFYTERHIILYGRSLGCAMAARLAATNKPRELILSSPVFERGGLASQLPSLLASIFRSIFPKSIQYEFKTHADIKKIKCPILILCGGQENDCSDSRKLADLGNNNTMLVSIPNVNHSTIVTDSLYSAMLKKEILSDQNHSN